MNFQPEVITLYNIAKKNAWRYVEIGKRNGTIIQPKSCSRCGEKTSNLVAHHTNYIKPDIFQWVCQKCHKQIHAEMKNQSYSLLGGKRTRSPDYVKAAKVLQEEAETR